MTATNRNNLVLHGVNVLCDVVNGLAIHGTEAVLEPTASLSTPSYPPTMRPSGTDASTAWRAGRLGRFTREQRRSLRARSFSLAIQSRMVRLLTVTTTLPARASQRQRSVGWQADRACYLPGKRFLTKRLGNNGAMPVGGERIVAAAC